MTDLPDLPEALPCLGGAWEAGTGAGIAWVYPADG